MITILDYGLGNLGSMRNMFKRIGFDATITGKLEQVEKSTKLVLPGVGAFDTAMSRLNSSSGLRNLLEHKVITERVPILGVCLGMQLFCEGSEEGVETGLGWIPGYAERFPKQGDLKVPHMGWNGARPVTPSRLTVDVNPESRYYFVHSYAVHVEDPNHSLMRSTYGVEFDSAIGFGNIYGVQFHPEKSHKFGMQILKNFAKL